MWIAANNELDGMIAEIAYAIEQNNRSPMDHITSSFADLVECT
jgi:hypothetical protein